MEKSMEGMNNPAFNSEDDRTLSSLELLEPVWNEALDHEHNNETITDDSIYDHLDHFRTSPIKEESPSQNIFSSVSTRPQVTPNSIPLRTLDPNPSLDSLRRRRNSDRTSSPSSNSTNSPLTQASTSAPQTSLKEMESPDIINVYSNPEEHHVKINDEVPTNPRLRRNAPPPITTPGIETAALNRSPKSEKPGTSQESDNSAINATDSRNTKERRKTEDNGFWSNMNRSLSHYKSLAHKIAIVTLNLCVFAFLIAAIIFWDMQGDCDLEWCDGLGMLIILIVLVYLGLLYFYVIKRFCGEYVYDNMYKPTNNLWKKLMIHRFMRILLYLLPLVAIVVYLVVDTADNTERLKSFIGVVVIIIIGFAFSRYPGQIRWRPVVWGLTIQFVFGLITIRWSVGRNIFQCMGDKIATFLSYADAGSRFVYGNELIDAGVFIFQSLSVIYFLSFVVQILYYYGVMQWIVMKLGWLLQISMGTTVCESVNSAASIFLSMSESPLLFKPLIKDLTKSELHAVMTGGFATVAGSVMAAYIRFGVAPVHLLTASVMSAPAALCVAKLFYPETEESKTSADNLVIGKSEDRSVLDAATKGAMLGIQLVLGIAANLIAFVSFVAFINGALTWFGLLVGLESLTLELIFGKVFIPLAWIMGVKWDECEEVARLVGIKTIVNEFVAYEQMGRSKAAGLLTPRSEMIATYALCGFSNPGAIGILIGALVTLAPEQRTAITEVAFRAFIAGSLTCFLTASIAGMLTTDEDLATLTRNTTLQIFYET